MDERESWSSDENDEFPDVKAQVGRPIARSPHFHGYYNHIHPALQQIPAHSTLELCSRWLALDRDITSHVGAS